MNITTPCHGEPLDVYTTWNSQLGTDVPDEINCLAKGCHNWWNADGTIGYWKEEETN